MTFDQAKQAQINEFRIGNYFIIREEQSSPGNFYLIPSASRDQTQNEIMMDAASEVRKFPTKLRVIRGGRAS